MPDKIAVIGQGVVGKPLADWLEENKHDVVRYSLEPEFVGNEKLLSSCTVAFICVPTPTTRSGFDVSAVRQALVHLSPACQVAIRSTMAPGSTVALQKEFPGLVLVHIPEFLSAASAAQDTRYPFLTVIGLTVDFPGHHVAGILLRNLLPQVGIEIWCTSTEAELIKYSHNISAIFQIMASNLLYDAAQAAGASWTPIQTAMDANPHIASRYDRPVHDDGRGAGGPCFIKDLAAFTNSVPRPGTKLLLAVENYNRFLLESTGKDIPLLRAVYD